MFSIYSSAFNLVKNHFDYKNALDNFCAFADEVVIAVNTSADNTLIVLNELCLVYSNLVIIATDFSYEDPLLDGKIKNAALQATTQRVKIGLDMDERIPLRHKDRWKFYGNSFGFRMDIDCIMIPSINLYGSFYTIKRALKDNLGTKWYMHKSGLYRGPVNYARLSDGTVDTASSDTCELIYENGALVKSDTLLRYADICSLKNYLDWIEKTGIFVYHLGYANFNERVLRNENFWHKHWRVESGGKAPKHHVHMSVDEFESDLIEHNLPLWEDK